MPVLKSTPAARPFTQFSLTDIEQEAAHLLEAARRRAEAIVANARADAAKAREEGREAGFAEGRDAGFDAGRADGLAQGKTEAYAAHEARVNKLADALEEVLRAFNKEREGLAARAGSEVPHLAVAIAERIIKRAGRFDPEVCIANATASLRLVMRAHDVKLNVHPDDYATIKGTLPELKRRWPALTHVELVEDDALQRGGCRVQTAGGLIDADLKTQLDRIAADLIPEEQ